MQERLAIAELSRRNAIKLMNSCSEIYGTCKHVPGFPRSPSSTDDHKKHERVKKPTSRIKKYLVASLRRSPRLNNSPETISFPKLNPFVPKPKKTPGKASKPPPLSPIQETGNLMFLSDLNQN